MTRPDAGLTFRMTGPEDKDAILLMRERATGVRQDPELWDWLFARNTSRSPAYGHVAESDGAVVAQSATLPVRLSHAGGELQGLAEVHVATDPAFQGRGVFTTLGERLQTAVAPEWPLVFGFPNRTSAPIYYKRLGWVELRPYPAYIRPLGNARAHVANRRPRLEELARVGDALAQVGLIPVWAASRLAERTGASVVPLDDFGAWADELWRRLRPLLGTCAVRDAEFLRWRFCQSPFRYTLYALDRGSGPVGFAVLSIRPGKFADLMELMVSPGDRAGAQLLLARAIREARSQGSVALRAIVSPRHPHRSAFRALGFLRVPQRLNQRAGWSFGVCILDRASVVANELLHMEDWYISGSDLDYI